MELFLQIPEGILQQGLGVVISTYDLNYTGVMYCEHLGPCHSYVAHLVWHKL